jgi:phosphoglycolate phosphatase
VLFRSFAKLRDLEIESARGKEVFPYTRGVLASLRRKGIKVGVMTRNCNGALRCVFPDIEEYADAVVTREDVPEVKPNPGHAAAVLARLDADPGSTVLVGDHPTDIATGKAMHTLTIGVLTGRTGRSDFEKAGADRILDDIREVPNVLQAATS